MKRAAWSFNRRRPGHARLPIRVPTASEPVEEPGGPDPGEAQDLSPGGVALRLDKALEPGSQVRVSLHLRRRRPLTLTGTVVWSRPHPDFPGWALGIRFNEDLSGEMVADIADEEHPPWNVPSR